MKNIMVFIVVGLSFYWLTSFFFHMPIYGAFLVAPLFICMLMFLFMDHGQEAKGGKRTPHH